MSENTSQETMVRQFHKKFGHYSPTQPSLDIPMEVKFLRYRLIKEEIDETFVAMGFFFNEEGELSFDAEKQNLQEIADGIADSIYVLIGTAISYGIPIDRIFREVHRSNMTKTAIKVENPGEKYGTKTPKGPNFLPPDIKGILENPVRYTQLEMKGK